MQEGREKMKRMGKNSGWMVCGGTWLGKKENGDEGRGQWEGKRMRIREEDNEGERE